MGLDVDLCTWLQGCHDSCMSSRSSAVKGSGAPPLLIGRASLSSKSPLICTNDMSVMIKCFASHHHHCKGMPLRKKGIKWYCTSVLNLDPCHWLKLLLKRLKAEKRSGRVLRKGEDGRATEPNALIISWEKSCFVLLISMIAMHALSLPCGDNYFGDFARRLITTFQL